jgi:TatD DNase family protein
MIVDSHAHYAHASFSGNFRYLSWEDNWVLKEGTLEELLQQMQDKGITMSVEPGISLDFNEQILNIANRYPGRIFPAVGCHPTRCIHEKWSDRKRLDDYCRDDTVVAIGETGLDYHHPRGEQHRRKQYLWFLYQLRLAKKRKLPLILHIRDADWDAIRVLKLLRPQYGGVVHCCGEDWDVIEEYLKLGLYIGIGGLLLTPDRNEKLKEAVKRIPLDRILVETDSPYVLPYCKDVLPPKLVRRTRNSSLILPRVIAEIAALQGKAPDEVERITTENAIRFYGLPGSETL